MKGIDLKMNIPQITDIDTAISIYYRYPEIGTKEIVQIFKKRSKSTVSRLKRLAQKKMAENNIYTYGMYKINTKCAYMVWGIDVEDLEKRRNKLQKLGL
jgi:CRISPR/Cas system CMR-associated protein Cmr3 (group 5 of RAMP superfamily)